MKIKKVLLSQIDKQEISDVISYSQQIDNPIVEPLLKDWAKAKYSLSNKFLDKKTYYTYPEQLDFTLSKEDKVSRFQSFKEYLYDVFGLDIEHPVVIYLDSIGAEEFFNNSLENDYTITVKDNKVIKKGTKIIKSFKYFITNQSVLEKMQNEASRIIQEDKISGYLTFSIHPLDFLSLSENNYNWRSCHALDGDYRAGNLSYMCDKSTMVVYLSTNKKEKLPRFPENVKWNSKKWRMLLHFDEDLEFCFAGRQYPFFSSEVLEAVKDIFISDLVKEDTSWFYTFKPEWVGWGKDYLFNYIDENDKKQTVNPHRYFVANKGVYDIRKVVKDVTSPLHFNDLLRSSFYIEPFYMYKFYQQPVTNIKVNVGSHVYCLECGEHQIYDSNKMICSNCGEDKEIVTCDCCGTTFNFETEGDWVNGLRLCDNCLQTEAKICPQCGDLTLKTHLIETEHHGEICQWCVKDIEEKGEEV